MLPPLLGVMLLLVAVVITGCNEKPTIRQYTIPGKMPEVLITNDRMLGAIIPQGSEVWFVKVVGPAEAIKAAEAEIREFTSQLQFTDKGPDLSKLPPGWNRGGEKQMRFATLLVDTAEAQLDVSISQLPRTDDWDEQVAMNVNRWRGQLKLPPSTEKWAGGQPIDVAAKTDQQAIWVDLTGQTGADSSMLSMPSATPPFADTAQATDPSQSKSKNQNSSADNAVTQSEPKPDSGMTYDKPESWRPGKMSMMRLEAFNIGPEDETAELTIIEAGGDLRGNVARWLGQVRGDSPTDEVVDKVMDSAETLKLSGREAKRYYLTGEDASAPAAQAIDATIVPMENGMSLFIKATGPPKTIQAEKERIGEFIRSLVLAR
ncbi:MAG: hypothetical protein ACO1RT_05305 [Planctomycetaceae bacterium]